MGGPGSLIREFAVGKPPHGFEELVSFEGELPNSTLEVFVRANVVGSEYFTIDELRPGHVFVPRRGIMSREEFDARDTCD
jgi:hypothetical protein